MPILVPTSLLVFFFFLRVVCVQSILDGFLELESMKTDLLIGIHSEIEWFIRVLLVFGVMYVKGMLGLLKLRSVQLCYLFRYVYELVGMS